MNKTGIVLEYDPFVSDSRICVIQDGKRDYYTAASSIEEAAQAIIGLAYKHDIYDVFTHAPLAITTEIRRVVNELEKKKYSNTNAKTKIKVEGI